MYNGVNWKNDHSVFAGLVATGRPPPFLAALPNGPCGTAGKICPGALAEAHHLSELMYSVARVKWWLLEFICFMRSPYRLCNRPVLKLNNVLTRRPLRQKSQALFLGTFLQRLWIVSSNQGRHFQAPSLPPWTLQASRRTGYFFSSPTS